MTTFSTVDSNSFPITTTMATSSPVASSSMNDGSDIYYYHPITGMTVLLVENLPHQPSPSGLQQHPLEQWHTAATTDPLNIYAVQHQQQQSQPQAQVISQIYTRTAQPVFNYNNIAPVAAGTTHQQQHHNQQNTHQQQQHTIVNTAVTTASTPMVTTTNNNIYLSNSPAATITATSAQPQRQQLDFLIKEEDLIQEIEPWYHSTTSSSLRQQDNNNITPISTHSAPLTTTTTSFGDDTLQDCIDMIATSDCNSNRVTTRPEDMYSTNNNNNSNNNNNNNNYLNSSSAAPSTIKNTSLVVTPSLSEPLTTFVGTRSTTTTSSINLGNDSNSSGISSFQSNYNKPTEHKRIKSMSAIFEQQQLQQQQQWNIDVALPEVDWQLVEEDPEALPRLQKPRYKQDDYNPKWVRYTAHNKEGYCDTCGRWLQLKNSAYWYHKQFYHGISSVSGKPFLEPLEQRISSEGVIEGLCHQCGYFVPICNGKRQKNSLLWHKHAHKCHVYNKPEKFTTTTPVSSSHRSFPL